MDVVRNFKANLKLENKPCGWCQIGLQLGEDASVCAACEKEHHQRCWDGSGGCSTPGCSNAPLTRLDGGAPRGGAAAGAPAYGFGGLPGAAPVAAAAMAPGFMACPNCRSAIPQGSMVCPVCTAITSPDGLYHGPKTPAPGAVASMVWGIVGLFLCGVVVGIVAISKSNQAKQAIKLDPRLGGEGYATAGLVLGILDLVGWAIWIALRASHGGF